jgi:hypothetical protein
MIRIRSAALALMLGTCFSTAALAAGQISQEALSADRKSCVASCTGQGQTASTCTSYCDCTVKGIGDQLSLEEYRTLSEAASKQQPAPDAAVSKLKTITNSCRSQIPQ